MNKLSLDWPQSAAALLHQAKRGGDLVKLIMAGTHHIDSWLIEHEILPLLQTQQLATLRFEVTDSDQAKRSAALLPLPDGSAFACATDGQWLALDQPEALHEIEHIGSRFAPGNRWLPGFSAWYQAAGQAPVTLAPLDVAEFWAKVIGAKPRGFEVSTLDHVEAFGLGLVDKALHVQDRLGL